MLERIAVDADVVHGALPGEHLELVVRRSAWRRVQLVDDTVSSVHQATTVAVLVRSIAHGTVGCATSTRADRDSLRWALRQARELRVAGRTPLQAGTPAAPVISAGPLTSEAVARAAFEELLAVDSGNAVQRLRDLAADARSRPGIERATTTWDQVAQVITVANSAGCEVTYTQPEMTLALTTSIREGDRQAVGRSGRTGRCPSAVNPHEIVAEATQEARNKLPRRSSGAVARPAVLLIAPRAWARLFGQIAAAFYGDRPDLTRSGLRVRGEPITRPGLDLVDDGTDATVLAVAPCDDEGTPSRRTMVIANGQLQTLLHDLSSPDHDDGESSTGNGWMVPAGSGVGFGIAVSGSVLCLDGLVAPVEQLLVCADPLLYVTRIDDGSGRGVDALNDSVRLTLSGWLVRGGEPAESVAAANSQLSLRTFLRRIRQTSDVRQYYRLAAGSTLRKGPAVGATHVMVEDVPITLREDA